MLRSAKVRKSTPQRKKTEKLGNPRRGHHAQENRGSLEKARIAMEWFVENRGVTVIWVQILEEN